MAAGDTDVKICSNALLLLGANEISSFSDGSTQAGICGALYPQIRDYTLAMAPWSFSLKKVQLQELVTEPVNEWQNAFAMPSDSLTGVPRAVFTSAAAGVKPVASGWEVLNQEIQTDYETIVIDYQFRPTEAAMPTYFVNLLKYVVAAHLAEPITDQITKAQHWLQMSFGLPMEGGRGGAFRQAGNIDGQGQPSDMIIEFPLTDVR